MADRIADNYVQVTTNRSEFPLTGGFFSLTSGHTDYTGKQFLHSRTCSMALHCT